MGKISTYARVRRDDDVSMKFTPTDLSIGKVTLTAPSDRIQKNRCHVTQHEEWQ